MVEVRTVVDSRVADISELEIRMRFMEEEALIVKSLARGGCHVTAAKAEKTPEVGNKVKEGALTADKLTEEQYQAGDMMQVNNKKEELARLLKITAERIEDTLEQIEDVEKARIEFYEALSQLDVLEDAERSGNCKEQELGNMSIRRFKRIAMQRLAGAIMNFKAQVEVVEGQKPEVEKQEVTTNIIVQAVETGPEKDELKRLDVKVDKKSSVTGVWRLKMWEEMYRQREEKPNLSLKVELVNRWKPKLMSKEDVGEDKVACLDPGDGSEVQETET